MANLTSNGLMNYGHFTSSKRAMDLDEPIYLNLWTAYIAAPDLPAGLSADQDQINIILEGLRSVGGLETQPGVGTVAQKYKHVDRGFAGSMPSKTHVELSMNFELNIRREADGTDNNYTYKFLRRWSDLVYDPQTGFMSIKKNYICKAMTITLQDKEGVGFHQWTLHNVFPMSGLQAPNLSYDSGAIWQNFPMTFWCDWFDESIS